MKRTFLLKTVILLCALVAGSSSVWADKTQSWDLTIADYSSATESLVTWSGLNVTFTAASGTGTSVNNYLGGTGTNNHTRFYSNNTLTFTPLNGASISKIEITLTTSSGGPSYIQNGTLTNCTVSYTSPIVTLTPITGTSACSVKLSGSGKNSHVTGVVVTYTGGSNAEEASVSFLNSPAFMSLGDNYTNSIIKPEGLAVTYSSGDDDIATVDASTGEVTGQGEGIVEITASWAEQTVGSNTYVAGSKKYELYVGKAIEDGVFDFTGYQNYGSGVALSTSTSTYLAKNEYVFTAGNITMTTNGDDTKYFSWYKIDNADNQLRFYSGTSFTLAAPNGYAITKIDFTGAANMEKMNVSSGTLTGNNTASTWEGCAQSITFTRGGGNPSYYTITITYGTTVPITITSAGWASFSGGVALNFEGSDVTAYIAKAKDDSNVTLSSINKVPAETGIVVNAPAGTYAIPVLSGDADATTGNLLKPWLTAGEPTETTYYTLAVDNMTDKNPVFYTSEGGTLAAGKAYLVMPSGGGAPSLAVSFGESTGVNDVKSKMEEVRGEYFNLAGQRVAQPTKGLYIVNGKKYVVK